MPRVHRVGDISTPDPGGCDSRPSAVGSPNVYTNYIPTVRVGDAYVEHCSHIGYAATGSPNVYVNNRNVHRVTDLITCGSLAATGSPNVFANEAIIPEYSIRRTEPVRLAAGKYAVMDEVESIGETPKIYPSDTPPPALQTPEEKPVEEQPKETPPPPNCEGVTEPIDDNMAVSANFKLYQYSTKALFPHKVKAQCGFTAPEIVCNIMALSRNSMECIWAKYPGFKINSGFRTATSCKSQHEKGMAADIQWPGISHQEYLARAEWITKNCTYDQFIFEHGNSIWLHISFNRLAGSQRGNIMTMKGGSYEPGLKLYYS